MNKVFVLTYNTADNPDRRIVDNAYKTYEGAKAARDRLIKAFEGHSCCRIVDTEIDEVELKD